MLCPLMGNFELAAKNFVGSKVVTENAFLSGLCYILLGIGGQDSLDCEKTADVISVD